MAAVVGSVVWLNVARAEGDSLIDESSSLLSWLDQRQEDKELEVVKASDPKKLIGESQEKLTSVSGTDAENTALNAESAAVSSMQIVYANDITESAILPGGEEAAPTSYQERREIFEYTVQPGDTVSTIARAFGIDARILLNDRGWEETIKPGETIGIPPSNDPIHQVAEGHTLAAIAQRYGADTAEIIAFNDLPEDGTVQPGQILIIPDGNIEDKPAPRPTTTRLASASRSSSSSTTSSRTTTRSYSRSTGTTTAVTGGGVGRGWCTDYAWSRRPDLQGTVRGNAGTWYNNAKANGLAVGQTPQEGAVVVTGESGWGHVGVVESVNSDGSYTISEQNYKGFGVVSQRKMPANNGVVKGFVY